MAAENTLTEITEWQRRDMTIPARLHLRKHFSIDNIAFQ